MTSLYQAGWRQGTLLSAQLPLDAVIIGDAGHPERLQREHGRWVVAAQDCDLDQADLNEVKPAIELRPVFTEDPPRDWGIRSARLLLTEGEYVVSASPRTFVSAGVLTALAAQGSARRLVDAARRRAFTVWLGRRYDRPAVPRELVPLAKEIGEGVKAKRNRATGVRVRDVLIQFDDAALPVKFSLFAVLDNAHDEAEVRGWLSEIALAIPPDLGVADEIEAASADRISLALIETSYSADVTQLTWRSNKPAPEGAV